MALFLACGVLGAAPVAYGQATRAPIAKASALQDKSKPERNKPPAASFTAEVMVLHATRSKNRPPKGWIDPRIGPLPELHKEPFSLYDRYELLDKARLPLVKDDPKSLTLPDGRVLKTALLEVLPHRTVRLRASINKPNGKDFLPLLEVKAKAGQAFIVAGQNYRGGILVLVIRALA